MAQLEDFVDGVSVHLGNSDASNVPRIAIVFAARQAVKRFCDESLSYIVRASDEALNGVLEQSITRTGAHCELTLPEHSHIIKVWQLTSNACHNERALDLIFDYPNIINLPREDDRADDVVVSLSINQDAQECPDFIFHKYYDGILSGILVYLQSMPNREWAVPNFAENHEYRFRQAVEQARLSIDKGFRKDMPKDHISPNFV